MYDYKAQRKELFTENGASILLEVRDKVHAGLKQTGAVMLGHMMVSGLSWVSIAAIDYLVERGEIREVTGNDVTGQHRVFVKA